jgi:hypothetical protein
MQIPRASLRSVLTGIVLSAWRTCRVSNSSTANPVSRIAACNHCDSGPTSRPIRARSNSSARSYVIKASGSLATSASRTILPLPSTTHTRSVQRHVDSDIAVHASSLGRPWNGHHPTPLLTPISLRDDFLPLCHHGDRPGPLPHLDSASLRDEPPSLIMPLIDEAAGRFAITARQVNVRSRLIARQNKSRNSTHNEDLV